jgi:hypothetical protein
VTNVKDLKEGDAFKVNYKGQEGHFHVKKTEGNKVTVVLDETGKETTLSKSELRQVLLKTHATALKENVEKKKQTLAKRKSAKAKERAQQALDRAKSKIEGLEDEPKQEKQEQKETSIEKVLDIRLERVIPQHSLKFNEQGLSTTAKDREIERFLAHIITDAVKDSIEDETSYTREEIDLASSTLGNPSMVLVARKLYIASVGNKTPDQIKEDLKLIYDRMKNDYTEYIKQRKQKKQERKQERPSTDVESILREVNTEFEQKKDELEQKQAEREKKRQERKQAKEVKEAQQREKKRAQRERRAEFIRQRKEREKKKERPSTDPLEGLKSMTLETFNDLGKGDRIRIKYKDSSHKINTAEFEVGRRFYSKKYDTTTKRLYFVQDGKARTGDFNSMTISHVGTSPHNRRGNNYFKMTYGGTVNNRILNYEIVEEAKD